MLQRYHWNIRNLLLLFLAVIAVGFVSEVFSLEGPDQPPEFMIKEDWLRIMKGDFQCNSCVSFSSLSILQKNVTGTGASFIVQITGHWTGAKDCIHLACFGFTAAKGISQKVQKTMNYVKTSNGWKFSNYH